MERAIAVTMDALPDRFLGDAVGRAASAFSSARRPRSDGSRPASRASIASASGSPNATARTAIDQRIS